MYLPDLGVLRSGYYELVEIYSHKSLSYESDKFPAFCGLAEATALAFAPGEYIAGVWSTDLARGLAWYDEFGDCEHTQGEYRAPTWSWAITDKPILFNMPNAAYRRLDTESGNFKIILKGYERSLKSLRGNVYGQLNFASLDVLAYSKRLVRSSQHIGLRFPEETVGYARFDEHEVNNSYRENHCAVFEVSKEGERGFLL